MAKKKYDFGGLRILIVEDDEQNGFLLKKLLLSENCDVTWVTNAKDALKKLKAGDIDVAYLDINLGAESISGLDLLKEYRALGLVDNIRFVALTAYAMEEDKQLFLSSGFDRYISKPYDFSHLLAELKEMQEELKQQA